MLLPDPLRSAQGKNDRDHCATEGRERGYYSGIFGIFDGQHLDSCVMIRFIENTEAGYVYRSGGGYFVQ